MTEILLLVRSAAASPEVEDEYNAWYDQVHVPQILERVPGVLSARRYRLADAQLAPADKLPVAYLAEYRIETDDPAASAAALGAALTDGTLDMSRTIARPEILFYRPV
ncbi:hypothetical protein [Tsukamurella hominis]|uniref:hypothetical protein n=1 Tax=Tsukamurella hominis TaxID=1970232 RepID=UPI0039E7E84D